MKLSDEFLFMNYLLEKDIAAKIWSKEEDSHDITQKIYGCYWQYHTERIENAFIDIDSLLASGKHAW